MSLKRLRKAGKVQKRDAYDLHAHDFKTRERVVQLNVRDQGVRNR